MEKNNKLSDLIVLFPSGDFCLGGCMWTSSAERISVEAVQRWKDNTLWSSNWDEITPSPVLERTQLQLTDRMVYSKAETIVGEENRTGGSWILFTCVSIPTTVCCAGHNFVEGYSGWFELVTASWLDVRLYWSLNWLLQTWVSYPCTTSWSITPLCWQLLYTRWIS